MNKNKILICISLGILLSLLNFNNIYALNFVDVTQYDFSNPKKIKQNLDGYEPVITKTKPTSDGGFIAIATYREDGEIIPGLWASDNTPTGTGTPKQEHAKIIKYNSNLEEQWEKSFYILLNSANPDPKAPTTGTQFLDVTELADGSFVAGGFVFGLTRSYEDDNFDAVVARFDANGERIYDKTYYNIGADRVLAVAALADGGYVIKVPHGFLQMYGVGVYDQKLLSELGITSTQSGKYYYIVFDKNNNPTMTFSQKEISKINQLNFINSKDKTFMENQEGSPSGSVSKRYVTTTSDNQLIFVSHGPDNKYKYSMIGKYDFYTVNKLYEEKLLIKHGSYNNSKNSVLPTNDGGFLLFDFYKGYQVEKGDFTVFGYNNQVSLVFKNVIQMETPESCEFNCKVIIEDVIALNDNKIVVFTDAGEMIYYEPKGRSEGKKGEVVNFLIDGKKPTISLGSFIENDRVFVNLNNFCSVVECSIKTNPKNKNEYAITFPLLLSNYIAEKGIVDYTMNRNAGTIFNEKFPWAPGIKYTVVHTLGSRTYNSYLEVGGNHYPKVFSLKSPTFNQSEVDVDSKVVDGQIYIPIRFIAEAFGRYVSYEPKGENNKPTVIISQYGEGEFYTKYSFGLSYDKLNKGDDINNLIESTLIEIPQKNVPIYGYAYDNNTKKILDTSKNVFVHGSKYTDAKRTDDIYEEYVDDFSLGYKYMWFEVKGNSLWVEVPMDQRMHGKTTGGPNGDVEAGLDTDPYTFALVSNVEGYPFIKLYQIK